jgi:brefeldin A-inhibited guanine nucleotide-exchange protein 3
VFCALGSIANQVVRLVGSRASLRPVVEALYHRMLVYPAAAQRAEPLRSVRDLLPPPPALARLVLLPRAPQRHSDDMAIIRL